MSEVFSAEQPGFRVPLVLGRPLEQGASDPALGDGGGSSWGEGRERSEKNTVP